MTLNYFHRFFTLVSLRSATIFGAEAIFVMRDCFVVKITPRNDTNAKISFQFSILIFLFSFSNISYSAGAIQQKQQIQQARQQAMQQQAIERELARRQQALQQVQLQRQQQIRQAQQQVQQQVQQRAVVQAVQVRQAQVAQQVARFRQEQAAAVARAQMLILRQQVANQVQRAVYSRVRSAAQRRYNSQMYSAIQRRAYEVVSAKRYVSQKNIYQVAQYKSQKDAVDYRDYQRVKAYRAGKAADEANAVNEYQAAKVVAGKNALDARREESTDSSEVREVVDMTELWASLDESTDAWPLIIDARSKVLTVAEYVRRFEKEGVQIRKDPMFYVEAIDNMVYHTPRVMDQPFQNILRGAAVVEYDFDNGMDKDKLARKILDDEQFKKNKKRLGK